MKSRKEYTIYDIADKLSISPSTVSRALKDSPSISKKTKDRIHTIAKELGYRTNTFARNLKTQKTFTIGVIVPYIDSNFISSAIGGIERIASNNGYNLIISQSLESFEKEVTITNTMFNSRVDGLLVSLAARTVNTDHFKPFIQKNIPLLFFDRVDENMDCGKYIIDNYSVSYKAVSHLVEQGCKNIVHIKGNINRNVYRERLRGYKDVLEHNHIPFYEKNVIATDMTLESGINIAKKILKWSELPDGIFVANDKCAVGCMLTLKNNNIKIPDDICVVGFNNDPISSLVEPHLSSVNYPGKTMGELVAENMIQHLKETNKDILKRNYVIDSGLIIRESSLRHK